jgi:hypothetical protein
MIGEYTIQRKVGDLPEGYEFWKNRFITDKVDAGCYVTYKSQDGSVKYLHYNSSKDWMDSEQIVDCIVDFVPDSARPYWSELQKLGKCFLDYNPANNSWSVVFPENPKLNEQINPRWIAESNLTAIEDAIHRFCFEIGIVNNGSRWFDCRDSLNIKKISDDEARKLIDE